VWGGGGGGGGGAVLDGETGTAIDTCKFNVTMA